MADSQLFQEPPAPQASTDAPQAPAAPAPAAEPEELDESALDERSQKVIAAIRNDFKAERAKRQAAESATKDARTAMAQEIGKALGIIKGDESADPAKLTEQLTASSAEARAARVELAVFRAAGSIADPVALLDSKTFLASVKDIDPTDATALQAAITAAVESNPRLGAASGSRLPAPNPAQGSSASGPVAPGQLSKEDVSHMYAQKDYDGIAKAQAEGRLSKLMGA